jgi:hypothetical protein
MRQVFDEAFKQQFRVGLDGVGVLGPAGPLTVDGNGFIVPDSTRQTGLSQGEVP